jgi:hypothetical protein
MRRAARDVERTPAAVSKAGPPDPDAVDLAAEDAPARDKNTPARDKNAPARGEDTPDRPASADHASDGRAPAEERAALSDRDCRILDFERQWWRHAGSKEQAIREHFQLSSTRYYQILNRLLDEPAALEHDPVLVKRLRRLRATRARTRTAGRTG